MKGLNCLQLLTDGDREGLACLYKLFASDLYRYGLSICGSEHDVDECLHDFFVFIWDSRGKFDKVENPKAYLMISFKRRLIKSLAKKRNYDELDFRYESMYQEESEEDLIVSKEEEDEINSKLSEAMKSISDREREVIHLKYFEKYKNEEIAELLEINNQSVRNLLYRAIQNLRKKL